MDPNRHYPNPAETPYQGMTVNERLFTAGLLKAFDIAARSRDRKGMIEALLRTDLSQIEAEQSCDAILANPAFYGF